MARGGEGEVRDVSGTRGRGERDARSSRGRREGDRYGWRVEELGGDNDVRCRRGLGWVDGGRTGGREGHTSVTFNNSLSF